MSKNICMIIVSKQIVQYLGWQHSMTPRLLHCWRFHTLITVMRFGERSVFETCHVVPFDPSFNRNWKLTASPLEKMIFLFHGEMC